MPLRERGMEFYQTSDFLTTNLESNGKNDFKIVKQKNLQPSILYPAKLSATSKGILKTLKKKSTHNYYYEKTLVYLGICNPVN